MTETTMEKPAKDKLKSLTLEDRYYISMYSRRLICTIQLRGVIDAFFAQIEITPEEFKSHKVVIDPATLDFSCADSDYSVEYKEFSPVVIKAMEDYIAMFDQEKVKKSEMLQSTFSYFRKII